MKTILQNEKILLEIDSFWAEINRLLFENEEIIYQKHPNFWQRQSPILFPIVWKLKNDEYEFGDKKYTLTQHGFGRDMEFDLIEKSDKQTKFLLKHNEKTLKKYPFKFELFLSYFVEENSVKINYEVKNIDEKNIYFSIGGHPAFTIWANIEQYSLKFYKNMENEKILRLNNWLLDYNESENFRDFGENNKIILSEKIFEKDAIILESIEKIDLINENKKIFTMEIENMWYFGIWKQKNSPFICLEPWAGFADEINTSGKIQEKWWIIELEKWKSKNFSWKIIF